MYSLKARVLVHISLILGLSWASGYEIRFSDSNWDTTLFLTPYGIVSNLTAANTLSTFYFDPSRGQAQVSLAMLGLYFLVLVSAVLLIRRISS